MNVIFTLSEPKDFFPIYGKKVPIELFRLENGILFDSTYALFREYFPDAEHTVVGEGGASVVNEINDKCDMLNVPSSRLFTRVFVYASFSASRNRNGLCLFHPGNARVRDMDLFAPVVRKIAVDPLASGSLVFYSFSGRGKGPYIEKGEKVSDFLGSVKAFRTLADVAAWKIKNKDADEKETFCAGSEVFSFNPMGLVESLTAENEDLRSLFHAMTDAWEKEGNAIGALLKESAAVLDGFDLLELVKNADDKMVVEIGTELDRFDCFGDLLPDLPLDEHENFIEGNADLSDVSRSAVINQGTNLIKVAGLNNVLVLSNDLGTSVRGMFQ